MMNILFVLNTQLADATKMREVGSEVRTIVTGLSEKARLYVLNIKDNSKHEELKRVGSWVAVC